jgi:hypothetical protein
MDLPNFKAWDSFPSFSMPSWNVPDEAFAFYTRLPPEIAPSITQVVPTHGRSQPLDPSPEACGGQRQPLSDTQDTHKPSMCPPTGTRKRKASTLHAHDWEPYKARIIELHINQKLPLRQVKDKLEKEFGFTAEYVPRNGNRRHVFP